MHLKKHKFTSIKLKKSLFGVKTMNFNLKKYLSETQQTIIIIAITFILAIIIWRTGDEKSKPTHNKISAVEIHTKIPKGYNLYALDIENIESLNSIVDNYALVNIYQQNKNKKDNLVLQKIKLIRSFKNPDYFAILATNKDLEVITNYSGPFKVTLHNPNQPNDTILPKKLIYKRKIIVEDNI